MPKAFNLLEIFLDYDIIVTIDMPSHYFLRAMRGGVNMSSQANARNLQICHRFYTALALHDLVNEVPLSTVCKKYGATKGNLQV